MVFTNLWFGFLNVVETSGSGSGVSVNIKLVGRILVAEINCNNWEDSGTGINCSGGRIAVA